MGDGRVEATQRQSRRVGLSHRCVRLRSINRTRRWSVNSAALEAAHGALERVHQRVGYRRDRPWRRAHSRRKAKGRRKN